MKCPLYILLLSLFFNLFFISTYADGFSNNCLNCHKGIEPIRDSSSNMMKEIWKLADKVGFKGNDCIICHGGNPLAINKSEAHKGSVNQLVEFLGADNFYPDPASVWINDKTCGLCHSEQVRTQFTSLMFTEAGKIQGTTWSFGGKQMYQHDVANIATSEVEAHQRLGSPIYKEYLAQIKKAEPQVYPKKMKDLPAAPTLEEIDKDPSLAAYTYLRAECQRCHIGVKGHEADGDYRGTGCGSCHIPYSNKAYYEGGDKSINPNEKGHLLVHSIQSGRDAKVKVNGKTYSGIPTKTCTSCHNRGRRIGVSYEGLMETSYSSPFMGDGSNQSKIHKKNYIHLQSDVHLKKGMLCQDCHTSGDMHSLGDLAGAIQAAVEIECQDCHGTPTAFPWDLPIGYGDEVVLQNEKNLKGRGVADSVESYLNKGWVADKHDGYLISARGNPMPHIVKNGDEIILFSASGKDINLQPLKKLADENKLSVEGRVAMQQIEGHITKMECYACHATWAPQCYGCHVKIDYSKSMFKPDWVEIAKQHDNQGLTPNAKSGKITAENLLINGEVKEQRSFLRWEDPPLVVNGEHRISPAIPGCQTTITVIDKDGKSILLNNIFRIPNVEGTGSKGQLAIDISPLQPHTIQKKARHCESCHNNPKAMGYGISSGELYSDPSKNIVMDLSDVDGNILAQKVDTQFNAVKNLDMDWSRFLDENGNQLQTVGHHFSGSRPLNKEELSKLDRRGVCLSCHKIVPKNDLASNLLSHVAKYSDVDIDKQTHDSLLSKSVLISAWVQILGSLVILVLVYLGIKRLMKKGRK